MEEGGGRQGESVAGLCGDLCGVCMWNLNDSWREGCRKAGYM